MLGSNDKEPIEDHPMVALLRRPNPFHSESAMFAAAVFSYIVDGNAYWLKRRDMSGGKRWYENVKGEVQELWYKPHWSMRPMGPQDGSEFITHYQYTTRRHGRVDVPIENVVHFRNGIDPERPQYGLSVIYSELREVYTDDEAAAFTAALLRNVGVAGMVVSPKNWPTGEADDIAVPDPEAVKKYIKERFGGDRRGEALVMRSPTEVTMLGYSPAEMDVSKLRNVAEERVCAAIGIPAAVVGFGTGLQQTKVGATMREMVRLAWSGGVIPLQNTFAGQLTLSLLPEFEETPSDFLAHFDRSDVQALQDDEDSLIRRIDTAIQGGWLRVDKGQAMAGFDVDDTQKLYLRGTNTVAVPAEELAPPVDDPPEKGIPQKKRRPVISIRR